MRPLYRVLALCFLTCFLRNTYSATLEVSTKVFRWQDEGGDIIPRILPTVSITAPLSSSLDIAPSMQVLGYGHQLGNVGIKLSSVGNQSIAIELIHNLFNEFPSNGFREGDCGFDPEHFTFGNSNLVTYYRVLLSSKSEWQSIQLGYENDGFASQKYSKALIDFQLTIGGLILGINSEVFLKTIEHTWARYSLAGKTFDVNIFESPTYILSGYQRRFGKVDVSALAFFLISADVGPKLGPCSDSNHCREGASDGFSPIYSELKFQGTLKMPLKMGI